jgi:hypothetical protein
MYRSDRSVPLRRATKGPGDPRGPLPPNAPSADALPEGWPFTFSPASDSPTFRIAACGEGSSQPRRLDDRRQAATVRPLLIRGVSRT